MPNRPRREKIFAVGRKAAGKSWRVKVVPETGAAWVTRAVWDKKGASATEVGSEIRVARQIGVVVEVA